MKSNKDQYEKEKLAFILYVFRKGRARLVGEFLDHFTSVLANHLAGMPLELAAERYFNAWVNSHWLIAEEYFTESGHSIEPDMEYELKNAFLEEFLNNFVDVGLFAHHSEEDETDKEITRRWQSARQR